MKLDNRNCVICSRSFEPDNHRHICCSKPCSLKRRVIKNAEYSLRAYRKSVQKFNSSTMHDSVVRDIKTITDPYSADRMDYMNDLPSTHAWNCLEPHPC